MQAAKHIRSGIFLSDLHLFSPRSCVATIPTQLMTFQREDQCIVLGGDIFDFRWSDQGGLGPTLIAARLWLEQLLESTGQCQVVYLAGNHDCHPEFLAMLEQSSRDNSRFQWRDHHLQLGDCLFLHGDLLDAGSSEEQLLNYRRKFHHTRPQPQALHRAYDLAVALRMHQVIPKLRHTPQRTCLRLWETICLLPRIEHGPVRRVFFGHTHVPIFGLHLSGVQFFNPGASLKHMTYHMHEFSIERE